MLKALVDWIAKYPLLLVDLLLVTLSVLFVPSFASIGNLINFAVQISAIGIAAIGLTTVIIGGGIDLSISSNLALASIAGALVMTGHGNEFALWGILIIIAVSFFIGALNSLFIVKIGMHHFITTISMYIFLEGVALWITESKTVPDLPFAFLFFGRARLFGWPLPVIIFAAVFTLANYALTRTAFGRSLYAIGGNKKAALISGVRVPRTRTLTYLLSGMCAAIAGIILTGRLGGASPIIGHFLLLDIVSACVLGGASLFGGRGDLKGTLFGVILIGLISNILDFLGVLFFFTLAIKGAILVLSVIFDFYQRKLSLARG